MGYRKRPCQLVTRYPGAVRLRPQRPLPADADYLDLLPEEDRARTRQVFQAIFNGEPVERAMRHRIRWPDGSLHWLEINGSLTHDQHGRPQMIGVVREITRQRERKRH